MGAAPDSSSEQPPTSALQELLDTHPLPSDSTHPPELYNLALQVAHNLHFQHSWTDIHLHTRPRTHTEIPYPRPIISGIPPQRLYIHPDEQIELLQKQKREGKSGMPPLESEREWVLPSQLREKWSPKMFGAVFDAVSLVPSESEGKVLFRGGGTPLQRSDPGVFQLPSATAEENREMKSRGSEERHDDDDDHPHVSTNKWRTSNPKRILLATVDSDSTTVYYIVHDGIVKPRQN